MPGERGEDDNKSSAGSSTINNSHHDHHHSTRQQQQAATAAEEGSEASAYESDIVFYNKLKAGASDPRLGEEWVRSMFQQRVQVRNLDRGGLPRKMPSSLCLSARQEEA